MTPQNCVQSLQTLIVDIQHKWPNTEIIVSLLDICILSCITSSWDLFNRSLKPDISLWINSISRFFYPIL
jgi:hypothetical protein